MKDDYKEEYQKHFNLLQECILNQDPKEWNKEFAPRKISPFLSGQIIGKEEVTSPKTVIKGFKFNDAVFENTKFYNIRFINCVFYNCDFAVAKIYQCIFENSEIKDCKFKGSTIEKNKLRTTMGRFELLGNNFRGANLIENDFSNTNCRESNFSCRIIKDTSFNSADLSNCIFVRTRMLNCEFVKANISYAIFNNCQIRKSEFIDCIAVGTLFSGEERLSNSDFSNKQEKYTIKKGSALEVNNIETSQFIRMISQDRLHEIINEVTEKAVLILGSFHKEHMRRLEAIKKKLSELGWLPIIFVFKRPFTRDVTETVTLLARISKFIIADLTNATSVQQEIAAIAPHMAVPIVPLFKNEKEAKVFSMFKDYWKYEWVLDVVEFKEEEEILNKIENEIVEVAVLKSEELNYRKQIAWERSNIT